ncbi:MAG: DUF1576 domain-containing protein [Erysipelotrichaceae bacterium]|jgi:hypothetical protein
MMTEKEVIKSQKSQYSIVYFYSILMLSAGLIMGFSLELIKQLCTLIISPCLLFTDYFAISSIGSSLINSGLLMFLVIYIAEKSNAEVNGLLIASVFIVGGFALFGKNLYNVISIYAGVYLYSLFKKETFSKHVTTANFGMSLAPLVSQVTFYMNLQPVIAFVSANIIGLIIGLILPSLSKSFTVFHKGFNIYNGGFTSGVIGMIFISLFRLTGYDFSTVRKFAEKTDARLVIFLIIYFSSMMIVGYISGKKPLKEYGRIFSYSGEPGTDFVKLEGFAAALLNMGFMGISAMLFALLFKAPFNGPVTGAILTVVGFSALSKHLLNTIPVVAGVVLAYLFADRSMSDTVCMINALFSTTLAPIAGYYGFSSGILAGYLHASLVGNLLYLHGSMNLYNNGFSGGIIAAILVPLLETFKKKN